MQKTNERTLRMMEEFIALREKGFSIPDIAKHFDLSETTIYKKLGKIAEKAGVTRKSLLDKPFEADHSGRNFTPVKPVNPTDFRKHHTAAMAEIDYLTQTIGQTIEDYEVIEKILDEVLNK